MLLSVKETQNTTPAHTALKLCVNAGSAGSEKLDYDWYDMAAQKLD